MFPKAGNNQRELPTELIMSTEPQFSKETLERAVQALAVAAVKHGLEGRKAFERILKIQEEYESQQSIIEKAKAILARAR